MIGLLSVFLLFVLLPSSAEAIVVPFGVNVDLSVPIGTGLIEAFGGTGDAGSTTANIANRDNLLIAAGVREIRLDYLIANYPPNSTTDSAYLAALNAGCRPNSVCDPNTWNWNSFTPLAASYEASSGLLRMGVMDYGLSWNATTAYNANCAATLCPPSDYTTYDDVVKKVYQHFPRPARVEIWNQPDLTATFLPATAYAQHYLQVAGAIRSIDSTIPIGGPATSSPSATAAYLDALHSAVSANLINFISYQNFNASAVEDTTVASYAHNYWPGIPIFVSEWNAPSGIEGGDGYDSVAWFGERLLTQFADGYGGEFFSTNPSTGGYYPILPLNGQLPAKAYIWRLVSKIFGLGGSASPLYSTSSSAPAIPPCSPNALCPQITFAVGTSNRNGNPIALIDWFQPFAANITVTFNHSPYKGVPLFSAYLIDHNGHLGQSPSLQRIPVINRPAIAAYNQITGIASVTPYSVLGVIVTP